MKQDNEARRKSDEKRKRKKFDDEYGDDPFFRGKLLKVQSQRSKKSRRYDDPDWQEDELDLLA